MNLDEKIILALKENSRRSFSEIGRNLNLTEGAIRKRVQNLLEKGTIKRFTIETLGDYGAIIGIKTDSQVLTKSIIEKLKKLNINQLFETTGRFDLVCMIRSGNTGEANSILEKIRTTSGVIGTETFSILKEN